MLIFAALVFGTLLHLPAAAQKESPWRAALEHARRLREANSLEAEAAFLRAEALAREASEPAALALVWNDFATLRTLLGQYEESERLLRAALTLYERSPRPQTLGIAATLHNLGVNCRRMGKRQEAAVFHARAISLIEQNGGPKHPSLIHALAAQGLLYVETGRQSAARPQLERAIALGTELFGPDHSELLMSLVGLAEVQLEAGGHLSARRTAARALRIAEKSFGQDHVNLVGALNQLGRASYAMGRYRDAAQHWNRALQLLGKLRSPGHPDALSLTIQLANVARMQRNFTEAERLLSSVIRHSEGSGQKYVHAISLHQLALIHADQKRHDLAVPLLRRSLALTESEVGAQATEYGMCAMDLARSLIALRKIAEAEELVRKSIALLEQRGGSAHPWFITLLRDHVVLLRKLKRKDEAKQVESRVQALLASGSVNRGNHTVDLLELDANR